MGADVANEEHVKRLKEGVAKWNAWREETGQCTLDLSGTDLTGARLDGARLTGANLTDANLDCANLRGAHLDGANLTRARLGANLDGARLTGANLTDANLDYANLRGAHLDGANLTHARLGARLDGARLTGANLTEANLTAANLDGANLTGANLTRAHLGANLGGAGLDGASLTEANLTEADLTEANLTGADLTEANLTEADLTEANLDGTNLTGANLYDADLGGAHLAYTNLTEANLTGANLPGADLRRANLTSADLTEADLTEANLTEANLTDANLSNAKLRSTIFGNVDLANVIGLETCKHTGPSIIDYQTLQKSGPLPLQFLRGVGLPNRLIEYLPSLLEQAIQFYSCFISYSSRDQDFADRLHADLQNKGVRCWFAPHDMKIGGKILDEIDTAIRLRDKVLLILSEHSIKSGWVEDEVSRAFAEERKRKQTALFPVRLDDAVMRARQAWAVKLRDQRNIGDFRRWKDHDDYQRSFERVLRDLKLSATAAK
jgi:uncharacterized protein YjbI with pentapeptide repeats